MKTSTFVALFLAAVAAAGCSSPPEPAAQPRNEAPAAAAADSKQKVMAWGAGWTVRVRPVFSGNTLNAGTGTVTITKWENGPNEVKYKFPTVSVGAVVPAVVAGSTGILRPQAVEGTVTVKAEDTSRAVFVPPALWQGGDSAAPGPLLWLPTSVLQELAEKHETTIAIKPLPGGLRLKTEPSKNPSELKLSLVDAGQVMIQVDGKQLRFPALKLKDDRGSTYTVLNSPDNPMVVSFRFGTDAVVDGKRLVTAAQSGYDVVAMDGPEH